MMYQNQYSGNQLQQCRQTAQQLIQQTQQSSQQYKQMLQQEQQNIQMLQQMLNHEQHAVHTIQQALQGHEMAIQKCQQIVNVCNQLQQDVSGHMPSPTKHECFFIPANPASHTVPTAFIPAVARSCK